VCHHRTFYSKERLFLDCNIRTIGVQVGSFISATFDSNGAHGVIFLLATTETSIGRGARVLSAIINASGEKADGFLLATHVFSG
jgi:hypothetical protein